MYNYVSSFLQLVQLQGELGKASEEIADYKARLEVAHKERIAAIEERDSILNKQHHEKNKRKAIEKEVFVCTHIFTKIRYALANVVDFAHGT